jgi:hypothetical protein
VALVPGGYIPTLVSKQRECWKLRDSRLTSEFKSRVHGQPPEQEKQTQIWHRIGRKLYPHAGRLFTSVSCFPEASVRLGHKTQRTLMKQPFI